MLIDAPDPSLADQCNKTPAVQCRHKDRSKNNDRTRAVARNGSRYHVNASDLSREEEKAEGVRQLNISSHHSQQLKAVSVREVALISVSQIKVLPTSSLNI
ncbi:unnamed protein product [Pleuronectes platessa]|uniref:Uncharacterized protein n=1 Tax=Pleuronectes platessa TaxID=8262 RepID=A0A9N7V9S2_PLEPL|nr:unnamed protein product [Pleuronectes platessa]